MAQDTGYLVKCRCGDWVPLRTNKNDRFYYADRRGCQHEERFDPSIDIAQDLPISLRNVSKPEKEGVAKVKTEVSAPVTVPETPKEESANVAIRNETETVKRSGFLGLL